MRTESIVPLHCCVFGCSQSRIAHLNFALLILLGAILPASAQITNGLLFYVPFTVGMDDVQSGRIATIRGEAARLDCGGAVGGFLRLSNSTLITPEQSIDFEDVPIGMNDFSVQIWVRSTNADAGQSESDVAFFGNKDWASGYNPGWVLARGTDDDLTNRFQWNFTTAAGERDDFDPTGRNAIVFDGRWHQIVVTHARLEDAIFYVDGALIGSENMAENATGTVNVGLRLALGNDGTCAYSHGNGSTYNGDLDEAAIWLRVLTPAEVSELYHACLEGRDLYGNALPAPPLLQIIGVLSSAGTNVLTLAWTNNGVACTLESAADLKGGWKSVPTSCTTNANWISATVTNTATAQFFRLRADCP